MYMSTEAWPTHSTECPPTVSAARSSARSYGWYRTDPTAAMRESSFSSDTVMTPLKAPRSRMTLVSACSLPSLLSMAASSR